jgi:hypothetical protein
MRGEPPLNFRRPSPLLVSAVLLALLLAQAGALAHAYSHLRSGPPPDGAVPGVRLCADCCLSSALLTAVGACAPQPPAVHDLSRLCPAWFAPARLLAFRSPGFRSRAPPAIP